MDEARRFLRYVIPGLSFVVQVILLLWLLIPDWIHCILDNLRTDKGIGIAIAALLGSGGLGFLFSVVHHYLIWSWDWRQLTASTDKRGFIDKLKIYLTGPLDHRGLIDRLRQLNILRLLDARTGNALPLDTKPDRFEAWAIAAALWHERIETNENTSSKIKSAALRADSLTNLVHSLGAARVASIFAVITVFIVTVRVSERSHEGWDIACFIIATVFAVAFPILHHIGFYKTELAAQGIIEQVLADALTEEASSGPVRTHVILRDKQQIPGI